jgi:hypothetical protein
MFYVLGDTGSKLTNRSIISALAFEMTRRPNLNLWQSYFCRHLSCKLRFEILINGLIIYFSSVLFKSDGNP